MLFNSIDYFLFLAAVFAIYWFLRKWEGLRILFLLAMSYFFYMSWNPKFIFLIIGSTVLDYICGRQIHKQKKTVIRKFFLVISLSGNLGLLFLFKYYDFFAASINHTATFFGYDFVLKNAGFILPVGISFYTFQSLSYTIDIYRKKIKPSDSLIQFAMYVAFFPQLVAGPIVRASTFLSQFKTKKYFDSKKVFQGLFLILLGMIKKVVIADYLAVNMVDRVFETPKLYSSTEVIASVYAYTLQIFNDFSGYSDIAIGSAMLFGYKLPVNFNMPYAARNIKEFWSRWHISLSTWLRDYLYISLGGNRKGMLKMYRNLLVTMLLGGLWHGAGWNFIIWGALHGMALMIHRTFFLMRSSKKKKPRKPKGQFFAIIVTLCSTVFTFHFVCFCWIFFRAESLGKAVEILRSIASITSGASNLTGPVIAVMAFGFALHYVPNRTLDWLKERFVRAPVIVQASIMVSLTVLIYNFSTSKILPFIYFQF